MSAELLQTASAQKQRAPEKPFKNVQKSQHFVTVALIDSIHINLGISNKSLISHMPYLI